MPHILHVPSEFLSEGEPQEPGVYLVVDKTSCDIVRLVRIAKGPKGGKKPIRSICEKRAIVFWDSVNWLSVKLVCL